MNLRAVSISGLLIVLFGIVMCNVNTRPSGTQPPVIDSLKLDCSFESGNRTGDQLTYSIRVPHIVSGLNDVARTRINHFLFVRALTFGNIADTTDTSLIKINSALLDSLEQFKKQVGLKDMSADTFVRTFPMADIHYVKYTIAYNKNNFLSVAFMVYAFSGGAHGYEFLKSFTFNTSQGKIVDLQDELIPSKKDSFYIIEKKEALRQYGKQMFDSTLFTKFIAGDRSKLNGNDTLTYNTIYNKNLYLSDSGLVSIYNPYEIAPYVSGVITVHIPFKKVKGFFDSKSGFEPVFKE